MDDLFREGQVGEDRFSVRSEEPIVVDVPSSLEMRIYGGCRQVAVRYSAVLVKCAVRVGRV